MPTGRKEWWRRWILGLVVAAIGAIASMLPLLIVAGATLIDERGGPVIGANERPDNAPIRAVGVVFLLSPILLAFGTLYYAVLRASLDRWFGGATLKALLAANTLLAAALSGFIVARELIDPIQVGLFALFFVSGAVGGIASWWANRERIRRTEPS